jgi:hypothetical protein
MNNKIFLQLSAWRDPFIVKTIQSAYDNAKFPENIVFGCVFSGYEQDNWMIDGIFEISPNVKLIKEDGNYASLYLCETRGSIGCSLMTDESYYMQTDCHTKFDKDWDIKLKAELHLANKYFGKSILSMLNSGFAVWDEQFVSSNVICVPDKDFFATTKIAVHGKFINNKKPNTLIKDRFFNAGMVFAYSDFVKDVPQPTRIAFDYEQPMMALKTFTGGYNIVSTTRAYASNFDYHSDHYPARDNNIRHRRYADPLWAAKWAEVIDSSEALFNSIIENKIIDRDNGMLDARTLEEYIDFIGYHPSTLEVYKDIDIYENGNYVQLSDKELNDAINLIIQIHEEHSHLDSNQK